MNWKIWLSDWKVKNVEIKIHEIKFKSNETLTETPQKPDTQQATHILRLNKFHIQIGQWQTPSTSCRLLAASSYSPKLFLAVRRLTFPPFSQQTLWLPDAARRVLSISVAACRDVNTNWNATISFTLHRFTFGLTFSFCFTDFNLPSTS